MPMEMLFFKL